jgi:hypothetical protein
MALHHLKNVISHIEMFNIYHKKCHNFCSFRFRIVWLHETNGPIIDIGLSYFAKNMLHSALKSPEGSAFFTHDSAGESSFNFRRSRA